ncbi:MAG: nitroreductase family protein [Coriobacteriia bacterium]|nr:nitroreductase family protein [Coriobacteriia bacterium]
MQFNEVILRRRTTRSYLPDQIKPEDLKTILTAAHLAPIAGAEYTNTHLTVVQDQTLLDELREACMVRRSDGEGLRDFFYGAPTVIFLSVNGISKDLIEYSNVACAIENMLLAATSLDLGSTYLWGVIQRQLKRQPDMIAKLQLPEGYELLSAVGLGYPTEPLVQREAIEYLSVNYL